MQVTTPEEVVRPSRWSLRIHGSHKSIVDVVWNDIPPLSVVTGPNGSGKSQLLQAIELGAVAVENVRELVINERQLESALRSQSSRLAGMPVGTDLMSQEAAVRKQTEDKISRYENRLANIREELSSAFYAEIRLTSEAGVEALVQGNDVAFVPDAFQSVTSKPLAAAEVAKVIGQVGPRGYRSGGNQANDGLALSPSDITEAPGRAVNVPEPLHGLGLAMQSYRLEDYRRHEAEKYGEPVPGSLPPPPWDVLNDLLEEAGFELRVARPTKTIDVAESVRFITRGETVEVSDLSSGERTVVGLLASLYAGRNGASLPALLLLDEPDAHLHPALTSQVLSAIEDVLVSRLGIHVVITTHSPSTVALAPDDAIFVMDDGAVRLSDKWAAVSALTKGFVTVGPATRFVFVEDHDDVNFYTAVVDVLERIDPTFPKGRLAFLPANKDVTDGKGSGGCQRVVKWTEDLNTSSVAGLIDYDQGPNRESPDPDRVWRVGRYGLENYLLDPLLIAAHKARSGKPLASYAPFDGREAFLRSSDSTQLQRVVNEVVEAILPHVPPTADNETVVVQYVDGPEVELPAWLLKHRGKDLNGPLQKGVGTPLVVNKLIQLVRLTELVPVELAEKLRELAES